MLRIRQTLIALLGAFLLAVLTAVLVVAAVAIALDRHAHHAPHPA